MRDTDVREFVGNFLNPVASNTMSSVSRSQFDGGGIPADKPAPVVRPIEVELFERAQSGDRSAFGRLVEIYQDRLFNGVLRMIGDPDEARELTQETFTRALAKLESFRGEAQPYTWLFRIAVNLSITQFRKVQRHRTFSLDRPGGSRNGKAGGEHGLSDQESQLADRIARDGFGKDNAPSPAESAEKKETAEQVLAALGRIDPEQRAVLVMRDVEGFDYQQMADVLDLPLGTLKSRLFRARLALREQLVKYME